MKRRMIREEVEDGRRERLRGEKAALNFVAVGGKIKGKL